MPMPCVEHRRVRAGGDLAALEDRHALARDRALLHHERDEPLLGALLLDLAQRARRPVKSLSSAQTQPSPAEIASVSGPMSLPCSG